MVDERPPNGARLIESEIKFNSTYGHKLERDVFTTIRGQDKLYKVGTDVKITLVSGVHGIGKDYGYRRIYRVEFKRIMDFQKQEIVRDLGATIAGNNPKLSLYHLLKRIYEKKFYWNGWYTVMQKVYLERLDQNNYRWNH